jgi:hypothetical protein
MERLTGGRSEQDRAVSALRFLCVSQVRWGIEVGLVVWLDPALHTSRRVIDGTEFTGQKHLSWYHLRHDTFVVWSATVS